MTVYFTPIVGATAAHELPAEVSLGSLTLHRSNDADLRQYLDISDRTLGASRGRLSFTRHDTSLDRMSMLDELQQIRILSTTHALVSELPFEKHMEAVRDMLHCWRLIRCSRVGGPITFNSGSPSSAVIKPLDSRIGGDLMIDHQLLEETSVIAGNLSKIPAPDLELFDLANEAGSHSLAVLFLVTILERSLLKDETSKTEITFKVCFYGTHLLMGHGVDGPDVHKDLKMAYKIRSEFVHSGSQVGKDLDTFVPKLYGHVAKIRLLSALQPELITHEAKKKFITNG